MTIQYSAPISIKQTSQITKNLQPAPSKLTAEAKDLRGTALWKVIEEKYRPR